MLTRLMRRARSTHIVHSILWGRKNIAAKLPINWETWITTLCPKTTLLKMQKELSDWVTEENITGRVVQKEKQSCKKSVWICDTGKQ